MNKQRIWLSLVLIAAMLLPMTLPVTAQAATYGVITGSGVHLRATAGGEILTKMDLNTQVTVLGASGNWMQVSTGQHTGYVYKTYLKILENGETAATPSPTVSPTVSPAATGSSATAIAKPAATVLRYGNSGADVVLLQQRLKELGYFTYHTCTGNYASATKQAVIDFQKAKGFVADGVAGPITLGALWPVSATTQAPTASPTASATVSPTASATATPTASPSQSPTASPAPSESPTAAPSASPVEYHYVLRKGMTSDQVKALQEALKTLGYFSGTCTGYYGSVTFDAVVAFQKANALTADGIAGPITLTAVYAKTGGNGAPSGGNSGGGTSAGTVNYTFAYKSFDVTLKLGSTGVHVKDMQYALYLKGYYTGSISGTFDSATKTAVLAYQSAAGLEQDGLAGEETLCTLYTLLDPLPDAAIDCFRFDKGEGVSCELAEWSDANTLVPRQSVLTIVDVATGYTFQVKRTGGGNHADCETLEALDTNILFKVYGNKWSWCRRAIWVIYNGHKYAASMNGMPHGYDTISGNDMSGQFCVHFVNSRTHGSNKIDPDHQACIQQAYQASVLKVPSTLATN